MAPRSKFTPEVRGAIVGALRMGASYEAAAEAAGVSRMTFWRWVRRGELDRSDGKRSKFTRFSEAVELAEAEVIARVEKSIVRAAIDGEDWRAGAWLLSKRRALEYSRAAESDRLKMALCSELMQHLQDAGDRKLYADALEVLSKSPEELAQAKAERERKALAEQRARYAAHLRTEGQRKALEAGPRGRLP